MRGIDLFSLLSWRTWVFEWTSFPREGLPDIGYIEVNSDLRRCQSPAILVLATPAGFAVSAHARRNTDVQSLRSMLERTQVSAE